MTQSKYTTSSIGSCFYERAHVIHTATCTDRLWENGKEIAAYAAGVGREIGATFERDAFGAPPVLDSTTLRDIDVCVEFTQPDAVLGNIRACAEAGKISWLERLGGDTASKRYRG